MASVSGSSTLSADSSASHKSDVWQYFTEDKERKKAKCQLCSKELAFHSGTTNLHEHLMNRRSGSYKGDGAKKEKHLHGQSAVLRTEQRKSPIVLLVLWRWICDPCVSWKVL